MTEFNVGIDLGTTNTAATYCIVNARGEKVYNTVKFNNNNLLPSCVEFRNGTQYYGEAAKKACKRPRSIVITNSKRILGRSAFSPEVREMGDYCGVPIIEKNGKPYFHIASINKDLSPEDVATLILKNVLKTAYETAGKRTLRKVMVTVPAMFDNNQRTATKMAAEKALEELRSEGEISMDRNVEINVMNEPTAAAYCYGLNNNAEDMNVLVYDFGGGTFDVTILKITAGEFKVIQTNGNNHLGGTDIDRILCDHFINEYKKKYNTDCIADHLDEANKMKLRRVIQSVAEEKKINLSSSYEVDVPYGQYAHLIAQDDDSDDEEECFILSRQTLNDLIDDIVNQSFDVVNTALRQSGLTPRDIDHVILVGGSSLIPVISEKLIEMFGETKLRKTVDASLCVSQGACMRISETVGVPALVDITTYSLSTSMYGDRYLCMIPKGVSLPFSYTESFHPSRDYMEFITSDLLQWNCENAGKIGDISSEMVKVGRYTYRDFRCGLKESITLVETYTFKENGIVHIFVQEKETGKVLYDDDLTWNDVQ